MHKTLIEAMAPPGGKALLVARAPKQPPGDSKRLAKVDQQEEDLDAQLIGLESSTRQRNREFEAKLSAVEERARSLHALIDAEAEERIVAHDAVAEALNRRLQGVLAQLRQRVHEDISSRFEGDLAAQEAWVEEMEAGVDKFIKVRVPAVIEQQGGAVTRRLHKARETFEIENAKVAKREHKTVKRFEKHVGATAQTFEDEAATRKSQLWMLGEDIDATERMDDRAEEVLQVDFLQQLAAARASVRTAAAERERQDCELLDSMLATQGRLQRVIVTTFGIEGEDDNDDNHGVP